MIGRSGRKAGRDRGPVRVPRGPVGRMIFFGGQAGAAFAAARVIKDARSRGDRLALVHGVLTAGVLAVTGALAVRSIREAEAEDAAQGEIVEPLQLTAGRRG